MARISKVAIFVAALAGGPYYRRAEVAGELQVSADAIRALCDRREGFGPSFTVDYRGQQLRLFTVEDVEALRAHFQRERPNLTGNPVGRPRLWTLEEAAERERRLDSARHQRRKARFYEVTGRDKQAAQARNRAKRITEALARERDLRIAKREQQQATRA